MKPLSLFNAPVFKSLSLLALLLMLAFSGSVSSAMEISVDRISMFTTDCINWLSIGFEGDFRGTDTDAVTIDSHALVVYDYYGNVIAFIRGFLPVGGSSSRMSFGLRLERVPTARPFTATFYDTNSLDVSSREAKRFPVLYSLSIDPADYGLCLDLPLNPPLPDDDTDDAFENPSFSDGRINNFDMAAPAVIYGHDYETGRGLVVYSPEGALLLEVRPEAIANVAECPEENTLIVSSGDVAFYRLTDCRYQLNAPSLDGTKTYVLIFDNLYNSAYISYEE